MKKVKSSKVFHNTQRVPSRDKKKKAKEASPIRLVTPTRTHIIRMESTAVSVPNMVVLTRLTTLHRLLQMEFGWKPQVQASPNLPIRSGFVKAAETVLKLTMPNFKSKSLLLKRRLRKPGRTSVKVPARNVAEDTLRPKQ